MEPATSIVARLVLQVGGYLSVIKDDLLAIDPEPIPPTTDRLLSTEMSRFAANQSTAAVLEAEVWMLTKQVVNPSEGYAFSIAGNPSEVKVPAFELFNVTVEQILDHIAKEGPGGFAWIALPAQDDYNKSTDAHFVRIISYSDQRAGYRITWCNELFPRHS